VVLKPPLGVRFAQATLAIAAQRLDHGGEGRSVGFLVVQDIAVILAMILLASFNPEQGGGGFVAQAIRLLLVGAAFVLGTVATMRSVIPALLGRDSGRADWDATRWC